MLSFERKAVPRIMRSTRYPGTGMYVCNCHPHSSFAFLTGCPLRVNLFRLFSQFTPVLPIRCRSERGIASKHTAQHSTAQSSQLCTTSTQHSTAQHRAISSAQITLGIIKSLVAPNHGPLLFARSHFVVFFLARAQREESAARGEEPLDSTTNMWSQDRLQYIRKSRTPKY